MIARWLLLATFALSLYGTGQVWLVQLSSYPLWAHVGRGVESLVDGRADLLRKLSGTVGLERSAASASERPPAARISPTTA
jgi:hypothetical protein